MVCFGLLESIASPVMPGKSRNLGNDFQYWQHNIVQKKIKAISLTAGCSTDHVFPEETAITPVVQAGGRFPSPPKLCRSTMAPAP